MSNSYIQRNQQGSPRQQYSQDINQQQNTQNQQHGSYQQQHRQNNDNTNYQHTPHNSSAQNDNNHYQYGSFVTQCVTFVNSQLRPIPITLNNNLLHMYMQLGCSRKGPRLSMLYDTGAALTSGYLQHHLNIQAKYLEYVHSLEVFDGDNPFDPIKLLGAIDNPDNYDPGRHGLLSAVVRYYTPYQDNDGNRYYSISH